MAKHRAAVTTHLSMNVWDAALGRMRWLFDEFDNDVAVANSGGKDSTVVLELAAIVNAERGLPPLRVVWLDQECEFQATVDYQRYLMYERDDIDFHWYQVPFLLANATTHDDDFWLKVWDADHPEVWVRPKEPGSRHSTPVKYEHFGKLLSGINRATAPCVLTGMRSEESPTRRLTMTSMPVYKWVTWGSYAGSPEQGRRENRYRFHPIYDWSYRDVWAAIEQNGWRYNTHYDAMHRYGVPTRFMRVSNYHHETALSQLLWLQEIEPETWEAATKRLTGISTQGHLRDDQIPTRLPHMFGSWDEYACYLIENLVTEPEIRERFYKHRATMAQMLPDVNPSKVGRALVKAVIINDYWSTTIGNFITGNTKTKAQKAREALLT